MQMAFYLDSGADMANGLSDRLRNARMSAGYERAIDAINAFGWSKQYYQHERGEREPSKGALEKYARAFNVSIDWLQTGRGRGPGSQNRVALVGRVITGAFVKEFEASSRRETVEKSPDDTESIAAAIVDGSELFPSYRKGDVIYWRAPEDPELLIGQECMITLLDGRRVIAGLEKGSRPGRYTLVSYVSGIPPLRDAEITEAAFVTFVRRARQPLG